MSTAPFTLEADLSHPVSTGAPPSSVDAVAAIAAAAEALRRQPQDKCLTPKAHEWLSQLPPRYQPFVTARLHPHIVNQLSALWNVPPQLIGYCQGLLQTTRKGRAGFSLGVLTELTDLHALVMDMAFGKGFGMRAATCAPLSKTTAYESPAKSPGPCERRNDQRR